MPFNVASADQLNVEQIPNPLGVGNWLLSDDSITPTSEYLYNIRFYCCISGPAEFELCTVDNVNSPNEIIILQQGSITNTTPLPVVLGAMFQPQNDNLSGGAVLILKVSSGQITFTGSQNIEYVAYGS